MSTAVCVPEEFDSHNCMMNCCFLYTRLFFSAHGHLLISYVGFNGLVLAVCLFFEKMHFCSLPISFKISNVTLFKEN